MANKKNMKSILTFLMHHIVASNTWCLKAYPSHHFCASQTLLASIEAVKESQGEIRVTTCMSV